MNKMPIKTMKNIFHVGMMDKTLKAKGSFEGSGLSISTEPKAWVKINPFTGGDLFSCKKRDNQFLDFYSLNEEQKKEIIEWGIKEYYVVLTTLYRITYFDDEMDCDLSYLYDSFEQAQENADEDVEVESESGYVSTPYMDEKVMSHGKDFNPLDLLCTLFVDEVLDIDGVWWEEILDVNKYSAPRGVIVKSKVESWNIEKLEDNFG